MDLDPGSQDDSKIRQLVSDMRQLEDEVFVNLANMGFDPSLGKRPKLNTEAPRMQEVLKEMKEQRTRLRERIGKPSSPEALRAAEEVLERFPDNFRPPGREPCKLGVYRITLKDKTKFHIAMPRRVNPIVLTPNVAESLDKISGKKLYCSFDFSSW